MTQVAYSLIIWVLIIPIEQYLQQPVAGIHSSHKLPVHPVWQIQSSGWLQKPPSEAEKEELIN